ncbi:Glutathione S-transferase F12 [Leucoagaricus sp. SymC.cos]|nr:Glutathione S-transferase F12 [Leucoagaricus sp. SymC.cos]
MVLKLYGYVNSTAAKIVVLVLREKQIPFEYIEVNFGQGEHRRPPYTDIQPFGQVPTLDDDGFILFESRAIARYIVEKYPGQGRELIPSDLKKRALFDQAASIEAFNYDRYVTPLIYEALLPKLRNQPVNEERVKHLTDELSKNLDIYEKILSKRRFLAGEELTLADLYHIPSGSLLPKIGINFLEDTQGKPNVARWFKEISSLESWQKIKDGLPGRA